MLRIILIVLVTKAINCQINITGIIKETEARVNKNVYGYNNTNKSEIETCGGIFSQPQFLIETPNYPGNYPNNLNCLFIFKGPYCDTHYTLQFLDFSLEDTLGCSGDRLEIKYKDALCGVRDGITSYVTPNGVLELNFVSNSNNSARGFRILVSRSLCNISNTTDSNDTSRRSNFPAKPYLPPLIPENPESKRGSVCCATVYREKRFFIASAGFPYSHSNPAECTFTIYKANPKVCRIRIYFHFFWVGDQNYACTNGYLQIDGKLLCGCQTGMKVLSTFDDTLGNMKVLRYKNLGFPKSIFSGFAMEVTQDECPERYSPNSSKVNKFHFYNDQINRIAWPNLTRGSVQEINDNTEIFEPTDLGYRPRIVKHVYYFQSPDFYDDFGDVTYTYNKPRDVEETTYVDTMDISDVFPGPNDNSKCTKWGVLQWTTLNSNPLYQNMPQCNEITTYPEESTCKQYNFIKGYFQSPGYPNYYPKHSEICYRFWKQRGFCKIRLMLLDFDVEESYDCCKDYLLISGKFRHCGRSLANTFTLFDMNGKNYEEIKFITDGFNNGRGFRGFYEQIPCSHTHGHHPHTTPATIPPPPPPTTPQIPEICSRTIRDSYFTIDIYDYGRTECTFTIQKAQKDICQLELTFVTFEMDCNMEYLQVQSQNFCGMLSGRTVSIEFEGPEISIIYKRITYGPMLSGLKLHLVGRQLNTNCVRIPPAQRILKDNKRSNIPEVEYGKLVIHNDVAKVYFNKTNNDICGLVANSLSPNPPTFLCRILSENVDCTQISKNTIYVPYNKTDKLELVVKDIKSARDLEFKEVTCDNKFIL